MSCADNVVGTAHFWRQTNKKIMQILQASEEDIRTALMYEHLGRGVEARRQCGDVGQRAADKSNLIDLNKCVE